MANKSLNQARENKNDEFYTQYNDIAEELKYYKKHFEGKVVFCNCDDPEESKFWQYFETKFDDLNIKKLIATHYNKDGSTSYALIFEGQYDENGDAITKRIELNGNGDFRSEEAIEFLKESDIVVTNPPFSLFREYIAQLMEYDKKFLIIGNLNAYTYREVFPLIKNNLVWTGATLFKGGAAFFVGDKSLYDPQKMSNPKHAYIKGDKLYWRVNGVRWFTNLDHEIRHKKIILLQDYDLDNYAKYDNYDAIEVGNVKIIPDNYAGEIGVPISFLDKYCPEQFEIIGSFNNSVYSEKVGNDYVLSVDTPTIINGKEKSWNGPVINKVPLYKRIVIKRKDLEDKPWN